jgi:hypothetical protein
MLHFFPFNIIDARLFFPLFTVGDVNISGPCGSLWTPGVCGKYGGGGSGPLNLIDIEIFRCKQQKKQITTSTGSPKPNPNPSAKFLVELEGGLVPCVATFEASVGGFGS